MKKVRLTPELEKKYREWLRAQHGDGLTYDTSAEGEVRERPTSEAQQEDIERWMRETNVTGVEFEEEETEEEEEETPAAAPVKAGAPLTDKQRTWFILGAIALVIAAALALLL